MREKLREEKRRKLRKILVVIVLFCVIGLAIFSGIAVPKWFKGLQLFTIREIEVEPPGFKSFIAGYLAIAENENILFLDMNGIYSRLREIYFIEDCFVEKKLPDTLMIRLKIRKPWVMVQQGGNVSLMDRRGYFLPLQENFFGWTVEGIPVGETGVQTPDQDKVRILEDIEKWYNYFDFQNTFRVDRVSFSDPDKIVLSGDKGGVYLQPDDLENEFATAKKVIKSCEKNNFPFEYVDVRFQEPYVRKKEIENGRTDSVAGPGLPENSGTGRPR